MDRTKKLLMSITASALLTGLAESISISSAAHAALSNPKAPERNLEIEKTGDIISRLLEGVGKKDAMSVDEILEKEPHLKRDVVQKALSEMIDNGTLRRTRSGTYFKYYESGTG
jgi:hypothetical protein